MNSVPSDPATRPSRGDLFFVAAFLALICSSMILQILGVRDLPGSENRLPNPLPEVKTPTDLFNFTAGLDGFLGDRFLPRNGFIHLFYLARIYLFQEKVLPPVIIGQDGWLYYTGRNNIDDYQDVQPFTKEELVELQKTLDFLDKRLRAQGIRLLVVIAPNKETIHPEYLPANITKIGKESRSDQLIEHMKAHGKTAILDLREALLEAKRQGQVFYRTDTHWNGMGSYAAYTAIMEYMHTIDPNLEPWPLDRFTLTQQTFSGDLANFLTMRGRWIEPTVGLEPKYERHAELVRTDPTQSLRSWHNPHVTTPSVLVISDSFGLSVSPLLAEHFSRFTERFTGLPGNRVAHRNLVDRFIQEEHADIVILLLVERNLYLLLP